jgi:protein involved in polysaccharide export with SLBB domain
MNKFFRFIGALLDLVLFMSVAGATFCAWGQQKTTYYVRKNAVIEADSRAEKEAEQMVSLSPEIVINLLRKENGLLLEIKKALVRKAYDEGRIIDPADLTDDSVFTMIREDQSVRVIATRQIVQRGYVRAKPTPEELARIPLCPPLETKNGQTPTQNDSDLQKHVFTQEETYWLKHDDDLNCYYYMNEPNTNSEIAGNSNPENALSPNMQQYPSSRYPSQGYPPSQSPYSPSQSSPNQTQPSPYYDDQRRQLQSIQMQQREDFENSQTDGDDFASSMSDELPSLLSTGASGGGGSMLGKGGMNSSGANSFSKLGPMGPGSTGGTDLTSLGSLLGQKSPGEFGSQFPQQSSLDNQLTMEPPPYYPKPSDQPKLRHRANPYADVPSLYDLYAQYQKRSPKLERFGEDVFLNGTGNLDQLPMDMPAGPEYVVGPGDGLIVQLTGSVSKQIRVMVDREGRIALPEVGAVEVSGKSMGDVQHLVQSNLRSQYRDVDADVSLGRLRTVRIYVVGDVERPGAYDVSSLSTPLNAVYMAGGPTSQGSLRVLRHYRGKQLLQEVDIYDLLLHGIRGDVLRLEPGDTVQVPPLGAEVTIEGMVRRPAIYELHGEKNLTDVLELAGGVLPTGTLRHVDVDRLQAHESRTMLRLDIPEANNETLVRNVLDGFQVQDGDKIKITPILPFSDRTVYLDGHVSRPGKFAYRDGMKVTDLIKSYSDLLPEPSQTHAEVIRLREPDFAPEILAFNLQDAMAGKEDDIVLKPFDTVRIFGRYDFEDQPVVTVTGEVRDPGDHVTNGATMLRDAIYLAGGVTQNALLEDAQVFHHTSDNKIEVVSVNLAKALDGDATQNIPLAPKDRIFIHRNLAHTDPAMVTISGEVARPGRYPLGDNMTAATLLRLAGSFKRGAYTKEADLTRYEIEQGTKMVSDHETVQISDALANVADADVRLRDGDVLAIRQMPGWKDVGATIEITGEVVHPGTYGIQEGERLSSIIQRAGGFRGDAYAYGAVFQRDEIRELEARNREALIQSVQGQEADVKLTPQQTGEDIRVRQAVLEQYQATLESLQNAPPQGRLVIHISNDLKHWQNTAADIQVRAGDSIHIPKRPSMVLVDGAVYNPTGISYKPGRDTEWYLRQSGGPTTEAEKRGIFVIRADGSVVGGQGGFLHSGVSSAALQPGDMVVVPRKVYSVSHAFQNLALSAQIASAVTIAAYYAKSF